MTPERVAQELLMRFNPLRDISPSRLVRAIESYERGFIREMAEIIEAYERRDDMMTTCSRKMTASVARCPDTVLIVEGEEKNPDAEEHRKILTRFWANVEVTSAFRRNERGGIRLLKKQMAGSESYGFACHEIVWVPRPDGSVRARFIHVPCKYFENTTGRLRFLNDAGAIYGVDMEEGDWMVTCGSGIGIAGAVAAMSKRLSLNDWLMYSERCGMPGLHGSTEAQPGTDDWRNALHALETFGRRWAALTTANVKFTPVSLAASGTLPYPGLVEAMNRAIAALYRGADLSTLSSGKESEGRGASVQGDETNLLEADCCEMISETLQQQVDRHVIWYETGSDTPLAYTTVAPIEKPNADIEMKIDAHLAGMGVKLSKNEALRRYQRTEVSPEDVAGGEDAALASPLSSRIEPGRLDSIRLDNGHNGLPNEAPPRDAIAKPLQIARVAPEGDGTGKDTPGGPDAPDAVFEAFASDLQKLQVLAKELMESPTPEKAREVLAKLKGSRDARPRLAEAMEAWIAQGYVGAIRPEDERTEG